MKLFGLYEAANETYKVFAIGTLAFALGGFSSLNIRKKVVFSKKLISYEQKDEFNYRIMIIMSCVILFYMLVNAGQVFILKQSGFTIFDIRSAMQGYSKVDYYQNLMFMRSTELLRFIYDWVILPCYHTLVLLCCIDMIIGKRNKIIFFLTIINVFLKVYAEGTRITLFYIAIYIVLLFVIFQKGSSLSKKTKGKIRGAIISVIILLVIVSNIRLETMQKTLAEEIYLYFCICVPYLDKMLAIIESGYTHTLTLGATSLYGLIQIPVVLLQKMHIFTPWYTEAAKMIADTEVFYTIRTANYSTVGNAYATLYYYFICDFGSIGVFIGTFIFGFLSVISYKKIQKCLKNGIVSLKAIAIYLIFMQAIITSFVRFSFARVDFAYMLIYVFIFLKRTREQNKGVVSGNLNV